MKIGQRLSTLWQRTKEGLKSLGSMLGKAYHWLRGRKRWQKWVMGSGGVLLAAALTLFILHTNGFVFDHRCQLPRVGSVHPLYKNVDPELIKKYGEMLWRVLEKSEAPPQDIRYPWTTKADLSQLPFFSGKNITALCEVEYLHIVNCVYEVTWTDDPGSKELYTLIECKVIRVLAQREDEMEIPIQAGDFITVFRLGNSTVEYYKTQPYTEGDRAVLGFQPASHIPSNNHQRELSYQSQYRVMFSYPVVPASNPNEKDTLLGLTQFKSGITIQNLDPSRSTMDQLADFMQKSFTAREYDPPF